VLGLKRAEHDNILLHPAMTSEEESRLSVHVSIVSDGITKVLKLLPVKSHVADKSRNKKAAEAIAGERLLTEAKLHVKQVGILLWDDSRHTAVKHNS
jgi:hypothetical protein